MQRIDYSILTFVIGRKVNIRKWFYFYFLFSFRLFTGPFCLLLNIPWLFWKLGFVPEIIKTKLLMLITYSIVRTVCVPYRYVTGILLWHAL
jgi:hypothetical protein